MKVRPARPSELGAVMTVVDSAMLAVSITTVRAAIEADRVLVAVDGTRVLGAIVLASPADGGTAVEAIAVRRARRGQGIGTALVRDAADRYGALTAEFDEGVRPFWASLGFEIEPAADENRYVGRRTGDPEGR